MVRANSGVKIAGPRHGTTSMRTWGASSAICAIKGGIRSSTARSGIIRRNCRSLRVASNASGTNSPRTCSSVCAKGARKASARGVSTIREPTRTNSGSPIRSRSRCSAWLAAGCDRPIRIAARLTLASRSSASSATSRLRSSDDKFMERIDVIVSIDWQNDRKRAMVGGPALGMEMPPRAQPTTRESSSVSLMSWAEAIRRRWSIALPMISASS